MLTLFDIPLSPYAQKVKMALLEKNLAFEAHEGDPDQPDAAFEKASPRLEVPALIDGDLELFDSSIIVEYLEDRYPEPALLPAGAAERARARTIEEVCDTQYDAVNWGIAELTLFGRASGELAEQMLARAREQVAGLNAWLERQLKGRDWLNGERFGFGDIAAYPFVNGAASQGYKPAEGGELEAWLKKMRARASAERLKQDVVQSLEGFMKRPDEIRAGKRKREYRDHRLDWTVRSGGIDIVLAGMKAGNIRFSRDF